MSSSLISSSSSRRGVLKGFLAGAAAGMPLLAEAAAGRDREETVLRLTLRDDHAAPIGKAGDIVVYDTSDRELCHGAIYVSLTDKTASLYVTRAARDIQGYWWAERLGRRDWYGPMTEDFFASRIQGRVVATFNHIQAGRAAA